MTLKKSWKKWQFDTGQWFSSAFLSRPGFFNNGITCACLKHSGTEPVGRDWLTTPVLTGVRVSEQDFRREVGIGSSGQPLDWDCGISLCPWGTMERIIGHGRYRAKIKFSANTGNFKVQETGKRVWNVSSRNVARQLQLTFTAQQIIYYTIKQLSTSIVSQFVTAVFFFCQVVETL